MFHESAVPLVQGYQVNGLLLAEKSTAEGSRVV
jgi:hypothetical protein